MRLPISFLIITYLLPGTLSKFGGLYVKFSLPTGGRFNLTPTLKVILCEYRHK